MDPSAALALQAAILIMGMATLLIANQASRRGSPLLAILGRWSRWLFFSLLAAGSFHLFQWSSYPVPILFGVALLAFFLLETLYNWMAISALSKSELPLFPHYEENLSGEEWPNEPTFISLRDWLRKKGFQRQQALAASLGDTTLMRISCYDSTDHTIRLQILLLPNEKGRSAACISFLSCTKDGKTLLTDNVFLPFGGFYPDAWLVERRPWTRSIDKLFQRHQERMDAAATTFLPHTLPPLEQIRRDQHQLESLNIELGFLHPIHDQEELGRLTPAAKARVWQEVWTLAYFGLPLAY